MYDVRIFDSTTNCRLCDIVIPAGDTFYEIRLSIYVILCCRHEYSFRSFAYLTCGFRVSIYGNLFALWIASAILNLTKCRFFAYTMTLSYKKTFVNKNWEKSFMHFETHIDVLLKCTGLAGIFLFHVKKSEESGSRTPGIVQF